MDEFDIDNMDFDLPQTAPQIDTAGWVSLYPLYFAKTSVKRGRRVPLHQALHSVTAATLVRTFEYSAKVYQLALYYSNYSF